MVRAVLEDKYKKLYKKDELIKFVLDKKEAKDDEVVYLDEKNRVNLSFEEIKKEVIQKI